MNDLPIQQTDDVIIDDFINDYVIGEICYVTIFNKVIYSVLGLATQTWRKKLEVTHQQRPGSSRLLAACERSWLQRFEH